jgi:hypothetical protein
MKNKLILLCTLSIVMQTIPMGNFANKALRRITPKYTAALSTLELQAAIAATPFLALYMANKAAKNFNKINPDETPEKLYGYKKIPEKDIISSLETELFAKKHDRETRNKIKCLAARLGISSKEFSQIKTLYSKATDPDDPFHHGKSKKEAEAEIELVHNLNAYSCLYYERYYATSEGSIIIPSKSNFIITSKELKPFITLHELVHLKRMNFKKAQTLSPRAHWWYWLHEEFRADYEALQVATPEEIQEKIQDEKKITFSFTTHLESSHWTNIIPKSLRPYAADAYFNLKNETPHLPLFIRIGMAEVALFCQQASEKNKP